MAPEGESASEKPAGSETLLDSVLRSLYDLGETEDETEQKKIRKKRENKKRTEEATANVAVEPPPLPTLVRGQKKSVSSFFKELREELHSAPAVAPKAPSSGPAVLAAAVLPSPLKNSSKLVEVVEFHSRSKKRKPKSDQDEHIKRALDKDVNIQEFNLEKARLEVHRFGITGYGKGKERVLERERAIMLGAKAQDTDFSKRKKRKGQEERKAKKSAPSILSSRRIGQVGKFKNGTLILSAVDIKKINSSRVAK
ncbi:uncharacterized protein C1orf131 homolog isoform X2 [Nannospalax galili]|uniref:uncharacterized protein C1orf131 homolog isoform X2 n=1 Tax=Nannospalax galili TaxID=1026970 RepID=UPI0004ED4DD8|nr:uncharacterized protein C1orf131 homolog isoform X2 [Nannospalax galili]